MRVDLTLIQRLRELFKKKKDLRELYRRNNRDILFYVLLHRTKSIRCNKGFELSDFIQ